MTYALAVRLICIMHGCVCVPGACAMCAYWTMVQVWSKKKRGKLLSTWHCITRSCTNHLHLLIIWKFYSYVCEFVVQRSKLKKKKKKIEICKLDEINSEIAICWFFFFCYNYRSNVMHRSRQHTFNSLRGEDKRGVSVIYRVHVYFFNPDVPCMHTWTGPNLF